MKQLPILGLGALALLCACSTKPTNEYVINGSNAAEGDTIYLTYMVGSDSTYTDSCVVANGAFSFANTIEVPTIGYISNGKIRYIDESVRPVMIAPGNINLTVNGENFSESEVTGSAATAEMDSLNAAKAAVFQSMQDLSKQYREVENDTAAVNALMAKYDELRKSIQDLDINFMKSHPASYYSPVVMSSTKSDLALDQIKEIYNSWAPEIQAADQATAKYIKTMEALQPGNQAPEITGLDQNGNEVTLSGLKGKVVLLDFWATWCGPCRASLPHVKELYEKYNGNGLEVLAVSLDRDQDAWKEYIANSGMGMEKYANIFDEGGKNAENYAIQYIPSKFIIDAEGNMVGRFDDEAELDAKLAEMCK